MHVSRKIQELAEKNGIVARSRSSVQHVPMPVLCLLSGFLENYSDDKELVIRRLKGIFDTVPETEPRLETMTTAMMGLRVLYGDLFMKYWTEGLSDIEVFDTIIRRTPGYITEGSTEWFESTVIVGHVVKNSPDPERVHATISDLYNRHVKINKDARSEDFYHYDKRHSRTVVSFVDKDLPHTTAYHIERACARVHREFKDFPEGNYDEDFGV